MGSPCALQCWAATLIEAQQWFAIARAEVARIEQKYSRYLETSTLSAINRSAGIQPIVLDCETIALLDYANACFEASDGRFDISSGSLRRAWDFKATHPRVPSPAVISRALETIGWQRVKRDANSLSLPTGMELDFGGVAKEYAADRAASAAQAAGANAMLVNLGGDIRVTGAQPEGRAWRIGITHPRDSNQTIATMEISEGGVATSGDYERYFEIDGLRYCHIIDARTGWPVQALQSVSVAAPACMVAGSLCTLAMLLGDHGAQTLDASGFAYIRVDRTGQLCIGLEKPT